MKYQIINTKAGWAVQNSVTMTIVNVYAKLEDAKRVADNLNGSSKRSQMLFSIAVLALNLILTAACSDDVNFYQQLSVVETETQFCTYLGAELQHCEDKN